MQCFHVACAWLKSRHVKFRTKWKPVQPAFQYLAEDLGRYVLRQGLDLKTIETLCKHGAFAPEVSRCHKVGSKPAIHPDVRTYLLIQARRCLLGVQLTEKGKKIICKEPVLWVRSDLHAKYSKVRGGV